MTPRTEEQLKLLAAHFDLQIEYVTDLPDNVPGMLQPGPDPRYIILNAHKSRSDHAFTIAHELGHYVLHFDRPPQHLMPAFLDRHGNSNFVAQETNDFIQRNFGPEWQADLWAFILLWQIWAVDDLIAVTKIYPKMKWMYWYSLATVIYSGIRKRIKNLFQRLSHPFDVE